MVLASLVVALWIVGYLGVRLALLRRETNRMRARLVEVDQIKKNFISHVSHELKAPLASMQETTHLLLEQIPGPLTDKQKRLLQLNLQSGKQLGRMIGNILDLSRLEAGVVQYEMQPTDIGSLMHSVVLDLTPQARAKSLRILTDIPADPLIIECDANRIVQLFTNLLENAVRFSRKEGVVGVHVRPQQELPRAPQAVSLRPPGPNQIRGYALIEVSDSGPGIEDADKESIFRSFHQANRGKKTHGQSLGLGLAISRVVVEAHRGAIWTEDNPSGGAIFFVVLPAAAEKKLAHAS